MALVDGGGESVGYFWEGMFGPYLDYADEDGVHASLTGALRMGL